MLYQRDDVPDNMDEWRKDRKRAVQGAELVQDDFIWDTLFAIRKVLFPEYFPYIQLYWLPADRDRSIKGMYGHDVIFLNREYVEQTDLDDLIDLIFHEHLHAHCKLNRIQDTDENGKHLEAFKEECEKRGGTCGETDRGYTETHLHPKVKERIINEMGRRRNHAR